MNVPKFIDECKQAALTLIAQGETDITWAQVAQERIPGHAVSDGDLRAIRLNALAIRKAVMAECRHPVTPTTALYFRRTADPTDDLGVRRLLPLRWTHHGEVGFRVGTDSTDLFWRSWEAEQGKKGSGLTGSMGEQVLAQAGHDGQTHIARQIVGDALKAPLKQLEGPIASVLGSTPRKLIAGR